MNATELDSLDFAKGAGLLPAVVQHADTGAVLMVGYMNREALEATLRVGKVTFYSRSRARLWTKGETSGHGIALVSVTTDCDRDALLVTGRPAGPVCHTGSPSCFADAPPAAAGLGFLGALEGVIAERIRAAPEASYTARLHAAGTKRMAQKVGEEGVEVALAALGSDAGALVGESADLLFHLMVLLQSRGHSLADVALELGRRHAERR